MWDLISRTNWVWRNRFSYKEQQEAAEMGMLRETVQSLLGVSSLQQGALSRQEKGLQVEKAWEMPSRELIGSMALIRIFENFVLGIILC